MRILLTILACFLLASCNFAYKYKIEQGKPLDPQKIKQLHKGQGRAQVIRLMGDPILKNTFSTNRLDYVYSLKDKNGDVHTQSVTVFFDKGQVTRIVKRMN